MLSEKTFHSKKLFQLTLCVIVAASLVVMPFIATQANAAPTLNMSTEYPGITAKAGGIVSFDIKLQNNTDTGESVALNLDSIPQGWTGYYQANGSQISKAYVDGTNAVSSSSYSSKAPNQTVVTFSVNIPADAKDGKYPIALSAVGDKGDRSAIQLEINISENQVTQGSLVSQYPELQGASTATFSFAMNLKNNSGDDTAYSLNAQAPEGWTVAFSDTQSGQQIASLSVSKQGTSGLNVKITPPKNEAAGKYTINVIAQSAKETLTSDLVVNIKGSYALTMTTPTETFSADANIGQASPVIFILQNTGSADLSNVSLTSGAPKGWNVTFDKTSIDSIPAGGTVQVNAFVTPATDAITGDYMVTMSANSNNASVQNDFRITVKTSSIWGYVAVIIIIALVLVLFLVFKKFGRR